MNPLAAPAAIIGGLALGAYLIPLGFSAYNNMIETAAINRISAAVNVEASKWKETIAENAVVAQKDNEKTRTEFQQKERDYLERINEQARTIEISMQVDPYSVGNNLWREFYIRMCETSAGDNNGSREACHIRAAQADLSGNSPIVSITRETVENWRILCEETGERDFCDYSIVGLRPGPTYELLAWLKQIDTVLLTQDANYDTLTKQIDEIINLPGPEIRNGE